MHWLRKLGPLGPLAVLSLAMPPISGIILIGTLHKVAPWLRAHDELGLLLYVVAFTALGGLALLPTYAQSLLGGWAFGLGVGLMATLTGFVGAALVSYAISWRVSGDRLERMLAQHTRWNAVYRELLHAGFGRAAFIVTLLRLPPNSPFAATNLAMAAIRVPVGPFALGTFLGLAPRTAAVVFVGAGLAELDFANRQQTSMFAAGAIVTVVAALALGWMATRALRRVESAEAGASGEPV